VIHSAATTIRLATRNDFLIGLPPREVMSQSEAPVAPDTPIVGSLAWTAHRLRRLQAGTSARINPVVWKRRFRLKELFSRQRKGPALMRWISVVCVLVSTIQSASAPGSPAKRDEAFYVTSPRSRVRSPVYRPYGSV